MGLWDIYCYGIPIALVLYVLNEYVEMWMGKSKPEHFGFILVFAFIWPISMWFYVVHYGDMIIFRRKK